MKKINMNTKNKGRLQLLAGTLALFCCASMLHAGGPLSLFAPGVPDAFGPRITGQFGGNVPFKTDLGGLGFLTKAQADALTSGSMAEWTAVPTASLTLAFAGDITNELGVPLGVDIDETNFDLLVLGVFNGGGIDVVHDDDGAIFDLIFGPGSGVLGFAGPEFLFIDAPEIAESVAFLNGAAVDPGDVTPIPGAILQGVLTHEYGHAIGLAHSQTNGAILAFGDNAAPTGCPSLGTPTATDIETMYPFSINAATELATATVEHPDDMTALSELYPEAGYFSLPAITGKVLAPNGTTPLTGVNVIARNVANPLRDAVSALSGDYSLSVGDAFAGVYTFTGLTAGANYVIYIDEIVAGGFTTQPIPVAVEEYFNGANESADPNLDNSCEFTPIAGSSPAAVANIIMVGCEDPNEPNNSAAAATGPIVYGSVNAGCIDPADQDWFKFSATAGDIILANVRASVIGSDLDPTLSLIDTDGTTVLALTDDENFPISLDSRLTFCMPSTGTFFLQLQGFGGFSAGEFELALDQIPTDESEPNNDFATANALAPGCPAKVTACIAPALDTDFWSLSVPSAGATYTLDMDAPGLPFGPPDAFLILYSADGSLLAFDDDSGPGFGAQITFTFSAPGTYFLQALTSPFLPFDIGVYTLSVTGGTPTVLHTNGLVVDANCGGTGDFGIGGWSEYRPGIPNADANHFFEGHFGYYDGTAVDDGDDTGADIVPGCFKLYDPSHGPTDERTADFLNENAASIMRGVGTGLEIQQFTYINDLRANGTPANWTLVRTRVINNTGGPKHVKWYKHLEIDVQPSFANDLGDFDASRNLVHQFNEGGAGPYIGMALVLGNLTNFQINAFGDPNSPNANDAARAAFMDGLNGGNLAPSVGDRNVSLAADLGVVPHGGSAEIWWVIGAGATLAGLQADIDDAKLALVKNFFTLYADTRLKLDEYKNSEGLIGSNANVRFDMGRPGRHAGDVWAAGNINVQPKNIIQGNLTARGEVYISRSAIVSGGVTAGAGFPGLPLPALTFANPPASARIVLITKDKIARIPPGIYNVVRVEEHGVLRLSSGVYTMNNLRLGHESTLALNLSAGPVTINVANILSSSEEVTVKINSAVGTSRDLLINYKGSTPFHLGKETQFRGTLIAPNALVVVSIGAVHKGTICAKEIEVLEHARILSHDPADDLSKSSSELEQESDISSNVITSYELGQNYPNPFNPSTRISFGLPQSGTVKLQIYDMLGNNIRTLVNKNMSAGLHEVFWNGQNHAGEQVTAGIYVYRMIVESDNGEPAVTLAKKMTFLK